MAWFGDPDAKKRGLTHELRASRQAQDDWNLVTQGAQKVFNRTMDPALKTVNDAGTQAADDTASFGSTANTNLNNVGTQANADLQALNTNDASGYAEGFFNPMAQAMANQARAQTEASAGASLFGTGTMQKISDQSALMAGQMWDNAIRAGQAQAGMNADNIRSGATIASNNITQGANLGMQGATQGQAIRQQNFENTGAVAGQNFATNVDQANTNLQLDLDQANLEGQRSGQNQSAPRWLM
jgi:hypothetical protein